MKSIKLFGYGSLLNKKSLLHTCPSARNIEPVILRGFIRIFNAKCTRKCPNSNKYVAALNIEKDEINNLINGILFEIDETDFQALQNREEGYELISVLVEGFNSKFQTRAFTFRFPHYEADYIYLENNKVQEDYANLCIEGSKEFGDDFMDLFLETTLISKEVKLKEIFLN